MITERLEQLFSEAIELPPSERIRFLERACAGDPELLRRLEAMVQVHARAESLAFLTPKTPVPGMEQPGHRIGPYWLREPLGEGGWGVVFLAEQEKPVRRRVALKVIKAGLDTRNVIARFDAEREALARMDHPHIAKVLDAGATDTGRPYFVMELVSGLPITEYCDRKKLGITDRLELFTKLCQAVQHAHQKGIIHRDLKPSNILVADYDGLPMPKIIDFGIAKAIEGRLTDYTAYTGGPHLLGTPTYMSPEQTLTPSPDVDTRSDIYSLGVLLYELLVGKTPFDAKKLQAGGWEEICHTIREKDPVRPSALLGTLSDSERTTIALNRGTGAPQLEHRVSGDLDWIVMKCLEKDRARRYETANGLAHDIQRHLNNKAVNARPPSAAYRFQKLVRRNKLAFTAAMAVAAALVIGLGAATVMFFRERLARQESRRLLYAADMNLAQQALKQNNLGRARRLLDRHRPQSGEEDLRGWEWRYLWQLTRGSALVTLTNRPVRGFDVSFSPDGTRLAVGWYDGRVDLWDVPGRRQIRALTDRKFPHQGHVAFSPIRNLLAATSEPKVVALYDFDSGRESMLWRAPDQGVWNVRDLAFSPDGSRIVIYAGSTPKHGDAVWVVNVSSAKIEGPYPTVFSQSPHAGAARLSPDNRRLYLARSDVLKYRYSIQCLDLVTGQELWQTEPQRDIGLTTLALSPDGRFLASGSAFSDSTIRVWDAATGRLLRQFDGHTSFVLKLVFTRDGRRLISAAGDQSIRFWDTDNWTETRVLRGHTDEVRAVAISEPAQLVASAGKDGNLMLWQAKATSAADGYRLLPEDLGINQVLPLDQSRVLLLPSGQPPGWIDLKRDSPPVSLPQPGSATHVLGWFGANLLCHWNGTNQIHVQELRGGKFIQRGAITLDSGTRPTGFAYNTTRQLLAWTEGSSSNSVYLESLAAPGHRIELRSDVSGLRPFRFSENGNYLAATKEPDGLRAWNVDTRQIVASTGDIILDAAFAVGGRVLVMSIEKGDDHEIRFYDLVHPDRPPRRVTGRFVSRSLAVSPDGGLVASSSTGGQVRLFDPAAGKWIEDLHGHLNSARGIAFSPDGRRLISTMGAREAVKLWDVGTRQELLTLAGTSSLLEAAQWSADGDVILAGAPWQAWRAPSWERIAATEAKEKIQK